MSINNRKKLTGHSLSGKFAANSTVNRKTPSW